MIDLFLRTALILAAAWMASRALARASAATRHLLWHSAIVAVLLAPAIAPVMPRFHITLPGAPGLSEAPEVTWILAEPMVPSSIPPSTVVTLGTLLFGVWFVLGWFCSAVLRCRASEPPPAWIRELRDAAARMGVKREVDLGVSGDERGPLTVGVFRATILLPPSARTWSTDRRRLVLLHELAHIVRGDCRSQAVAHAACALYWFNPLVWLATRELRRERERACDDLVLRHGTRPSDYAACLLDIASAMRSRPTPSAALAMARRSELEGRLLAVLGNRARRSAGATRRLVPLAVALCSFGLLGVETVRSSALVESAPAQSAPQVDRAPAPSADNALRRQEATEAARTLRSSSDPAERSRAALALADAGQPDAVGPLAKALDDSSRSVREKAALALGLQSDPAAVAPLIRALADPDAQVREKAALGLALRRDASVVEPLIVALGDPDGQVREKAAIALGTSADPRARPALESALQDPDPQVREKAVTGLTLLGMSATPSDGDHVRDGLRGLVGALLGLVR